MGIYQWCWRCYNSAAPLLFFPNTCPSVSPLLLLLLLGSLSSFSAAAAAMLLVCASHLPTFINSEKNSLPGFPLKTSFSVKLEDLKNDTYPNPYLRVSWLECNVVLQNWCKSNKVLNSVSFDLHTVVRSSHYWNYLFLSETAATNNTKRKRIASSPLNPQTQI